MTCDDVRDLLAVRVLGAVTLKEAARVDAHLDHCSRCRVHARALGDTADALVHAEGPPPAGVWENVAAQIDLLDDRPRRRHEGRYDRHLAQGFQRALIPRRLPTVSGWAIAAAYESADDNLLIGGDFYDVSTLSTGGVAVIVGDLSCAGPPGAMLALSIRNALKGVMWHNADPQRTMAAVEEVLVGELADTWVRMTLIVAEPDTGSVQIVSAGAPAPWLAIAQRPVIVTRNAPLGLARDTPWTVTDIEVSHGETLLAMSQGVADAWLGQEDEWNESVVGLFQETSSDARSHDVALSVLDLARSRTTTKSDLIVVALAREPLEEGLTRRA